AAENLIEHGDIDLLGLADEAEVHHLFDVGAGIGHAAADLAGDDHVAVLAAQPDRLATRLVDEADDLLVDRTCKHHLDDFDGGSVGDAKASRKPRLDA